MNKVSLHFDKPGLQTLVQDKGRMGHLAFGVPIGGVMDKSSAQIANWLVGNNDSSPVLEIALAGPHIKFEGNCQLAITGANITPMVNNIPAQMYETITVKDGSELSFGPVKSGCRAYLAIGGEWKAQKWLGSSSAFLLSEQNLTPDSSPVRDSSLTINTTTSIHKRGFPKILRPEFPLVIHIGVIPGPEFEDFSEYSVNNFLHQGHKLSIDSNRMGYRLDSQLLGFDPQQEVISSGIVTGTIQITNSGQPIILMADAQTTGGYPRIANVITAHLDRLAQAKPGDEVMFSKVNLRDAYQALRDKDEMLKLVLT